MFINKFDTQKQACDYYGRTWKYIENHYKVTRSYDSSGFRGYSISKR